MKKIIVFSFALVLFSSSFLSATEGFVQLNSFFHRASYPLEASGGVDTVRYFASGVGIKTAWGKTWQGVFDATIFFPFDVEEKIYPATTFVPVVTNNKIFATDFQAGIGYNFGVSPLSFFLSESIHTGVFFEGSHTLISIGLGLDLQAQVELSRAFTVQVGLSFIMDFFGTWDATITPNALGGIPIRFNLYTGIGFKKQPKVVSF